MAFLIILGLVFSPASAAYATSSSSGAVATCADRTRYAQDGTGATVGELSKNPVALMVPKPECWMAATWKTINENFQIPRFIKPVAIALALVAFVSQIYGHMTRSNPGGMMQTVVRGIVAGMVISMSTAAPGKEPTIPGFLRSTWAASYGYANGKAAENLTPKIEAAAQATTDVLLNGPIGLFGQAGLFKGATKGLMAARGAAVKEAATDVAESGTAAAAGNTLKKTTKEQLANSKDMQSKLSKGLTLGYVLVLPFLSAYAGAVYASGMLTIGLGLVMPLLGAFVLLGSTKPLIGAFTAFLSNMLVIFILPASFMIALDIGFLQPQMIMQTYYDQAQQEMQNRLPELSANLGAIEDGNVAPAGTNPTAEWLGIGSAVRDFTEVTKKVGAYMRFIGDPEMWKVLASQVKWVLIGSILGIITLLMSFGLATAVMVAMPKMMGGLLGAQIDALASRNDGLSIIGKALKR
ncbi:hypothetical protein [Deinococcus soli (ex Cha et al. 2016)]|uniref:Uncharacterized protein n=2 Tax=Deinococcus soli (ex Cha et al. 2016) TaxID=1309411 RepID=A0AAE3XF10_9DEIO|nr:hypothetical protein [Deinococcus soli (ex Cha et al. 2016)]MDR6218518.1 hypothetical protein [Deinococcus soli (ex Cha et al. 2016)]MDR6329258.1 hypothetical protein [Deinococcus soli (ex Cha et al. 2016)]MDR6751531.1 hypothetical protein [Deinococcus soli (ex Cha et al. 2016)]